MGSISLVGGHIFNLFNKTCAKCTTIIKTKMFGKHNDFFIMSVTGKAEEEK